MFSTFAPPLLIFVFYSLPFVGDLDWGTIGKTKIKLGLPIPVLLLKDFGLVDKGDKNTFSIRTEKFDNKVIQRGMNHEVQATFSMRIDSTLAQIVIPLMEKCFEFMDKDAYDVSYLNGETLIFNGKISDFQTFPNADNNNLLDMAFTITTNPASLGFDALTGDTASTTEVMVEAGKEQI